ncbi:MAG: J domain-containing protein [Acidobacteriota bacterium]
MDEKAFAVLGLAPGANGEAIEAAYRRLARRYPPELNPLRFAQIKDAYEILTSLERRMREAEDDPARALAALFPAVELRLAAPPDPPPPGSTPDWEPRQAPLRATAIAGILRAAFGRGEERGSNLRRSTGGRSPDP